MIEYLTTASGGIAMGNMLSQSPNGRDFNDATGRIYTMSLLLEQLEKDWAAAQKKAAATPPPEVVYPARQR